MDLRELVEQLPDGVGPRMTGNIRQYRRCGSNAYRRGGYYTRYGRRRSFRLFDDEHDFVVMDAAFGDSVPLILLESENEARSDKCIAPPPSHSQRSLTI